MAHFKSMLAGIGIGAGVALLVRKALKPGVSLDWSHDHWREGQLEPEDSRSETHVPNFREHSIVSAPGQTVSATESELRRTGTDNPVRYTTNPKASPASGGEAPFLKKDKS